MSVRPLACLRAGVTRFIGDMSHDLIGRGALSLLDFDAQALAIYRHTMHSVDGVLSRNRIVVIYKAKALGGAGAAVLVDHCVQKVSWRSKRCKTLR